MNTGRHIYTSGEWFCDRDGRAVMLRGVNLSGGSKMPSRPYGATHNREGFFNHREVSFTGRPFPLEDAPQHFNRLRSWGFNFLRFLVTWEAIEHAGPGLYDEEYLEYAAQLIHMAGEYGFYVMVDPHEDVWSRFTGGDGAPGWTLEAVGFQLEHLHDTGAAVVHALHGDPFPRMIWPTNNNRLAAATMFTLFFGGNDFAPGFTVEGQPVQEYLQGHYLGAVRQLVQRLRGMEHVLGYDTLNEPSRGYIGWQDLSRPDGLLRIGETPSPLQSMALGGGLAQEVDVYQVGLLGIRRVAKKLLNPQGLKAWRDGFDCVWRKMGVWEAALNGQPHLLRPDHFTRVDGRRVDFGRDYLRPFANRFAHMVHSEDRQALIFLEMEPGCEPPQWSESDAPSIVYAPHWYDPFVLILKDFKSWISFDVKKKRPVLGPRSIRRTFAGHLNYYKDLAKRRLGGCPTVLGEVGIAFDLQDGRAYRSGDFSLQRRALERTFHAVEDALMNMALWNYTPENSHERGDLWNGEDLSIFSPDDARGREGVNAGGRALEAVVRPYPRATSGKPLRLFFDSLKSEFMFAFQQALPSPQPTEIYLPALHYPGACRVEVSDGRWEVDWDQQILRYWPGFNRGEHRIRVKRQ